MTLLKINLVFIECSGGAGKRLVDESAELLTRGWFVTLCHEPALCCPPGTIQEDYLRELLTTMGDRFTDKEVDELYREAPIDKKGNFNYIEFTRILKHGAKD